MINDEFRTFFADHRWSDQRGSRTLAEMVDLVASGRIIVPIAATYPLDQVQEAYAQLEKRHTRGKIVLIP